MTEGRRIGRLRRQVGITQLRLAKMAGISGPALSLFENGFLALRPARIQALEAALRREVRRQDREQHRRHQLLGLEARAQTESAQA